MLNTKICKRCCIEKSLNEFYKKGNYYREICKECSLKDFRKAGNKWAQEHKSVYDKNKRKEYRLKNKLKIKKYRKKYNLKNKEKNSNYIKEYRKNIIPKISNYLRTRVYIAIKGNVKSDKTMNLIGCNIEFLKNYLESKFKPGMSWDNYGKYGWHVDHIKPCVKFDLSNPSEQRKCFNYKNLQPLWAEENWSKNDKY